MAESPSRLGRGLGAGMVFGLYVSVFVQFSLNEMAELPSSPQNFCWYYDFFFVK